VDFGANPGGDCDRSADGSKLAFTYEILDNDDFLASASLRWLDLQDPGKVHEIAPELKLLSRVFWSPVSDQIAFSACREDGPCGIYLYDLPADEVRLLTGAGATMWDLLWKPDGTQLAFVSTMDDRYPYYVMDAASGEILAQGIFDADAWKFPEDAPVNEWGVSFPRGYSGTRCFVNP
jgi:Tol biopolymer transport system component